MDTDTLPAFRQLMKGIVEKHPSHATPPISFGDTDIDEAFGGGIVRDGLHDIYAAGTADIGAATGFAAALSLRAAMGQPILWVRQEFLDTETGNLHAPGLAGLGLDPKRVILVRAQNSEGLLRAGEQGVRCSALGAVLIEPWGEPKALDFTASRRLALASSKSGVPAFMLRICASPAQSAAATRWKVRSLPSRELAGNAPGFPAFELNLLRHRGGLQGHSWNVEWNRDQRCFKQRQSSRAAPLSRSVVSLSNHRSAATGARGQELLRAV
jgi:protein ImuA